MLGIYLITNENGQEVSGNYVTSLTRSHKPFNGDFQLGSTTSCSYELEVVKYANMPSFECDYVLITGDRERQIAKLYVDSVEDVDDKVVRVTMTDGMVLFNFSYDPKPLLEASTHSDDNGKYVTLGEVLDDICEQAGVDYDALPSYPLLKFRRTDTFSAREFIRDIAEISACRAVIDGATGLLKFKNYNNSTNYEIDVRSCTSLKIGETHTISRVVFDDGEVVASNGATTGDTVYLNTGNMFLGENETSSGSSVSLQDMVDSIASDIIDFVYTSIKIDGCPIPEKATAGDCVDFINGSNVYHTIWSIDQHYNGQWLGGLDSDYKSTLQQETTVVGSNDETKKIVTKIDRELNKITTEISEVVKISDDDYQMLVTTIEKTIDGINVKASNSDTYVHIGNDIVEIVNNGKRTQAMSDGQFISGEWVIGEMNNGKGLAIFRKG